ncbi:synaptonemal complex central element protein 2 isoform X1 [Myotis daubentonii]|uniref:synaptonemal complex central element protein 2 isoform X1 n=1 Tax=Myotis daubentonii TaxID=98922 RepID=UPI0028737D9D|nr:synaptonemal complex central element protein 2 isoform X1 [Myotis daubentonii]
MSSLPLRAGLVHEITKHHPREIHNTVSSPTMELIHVSHSGENLGLTSVSYTFKSQVSSPSVATSSANRQLMMLEGKLGPYFSSLDSSIEILKKRTQELIENINESRQKDHALMTNFRDSLKIKVSDLTEKLEERMYQLYNHHNKIIQEKLQEFTQKMAKISHLETELKQVCHTVETVYKDFQDLCVQPEAPTLEEEQAHKDGKC